MELLILAHAPTRILEQGLLPAAADLQLKVTILTDCVGEHIVRARHSPLYGQCELGECDVFNPLAVARFLSVHGRRVDGVLAAHAVLHASAAVSAASLGLPGASWRPAVRHDQRRDPVAVPHARRIIDCAEPPAGIGADWFPASVQPLEGGAASGGAIVRDMEELRRSLGALRHGYALVEKHRDDEVVYALDALATTEGFAILSGSRIAFDQDPQRTKRVQSFMPRPPRCDELLTLLQPHELGLGRHHVEYALSPAGLRLRDIHNGLHDDESELALDDRLDGNLFAAVLKTSLGLPVTPPHLLHIDAPAAVARETA
ncbi:hypothetical protein [Duganella radicis]|uniref:ATP-grasp domain-containing protein n=1 Tax=Duganella radicis TaxID=551988 RepID=A0A6L6PDT4_9BURK|nr:hypothetical protein [Duganella radicis]MTV36741.1 hypothetical protein [Duganella radicis]